MVGVGGFDHGETRQAGRVRRSDVGLDWLQSVIAGAHPPCSVGALDRETWGTTLRFQAWSVTLVLARRAS